MDNKEDLYDKEKCFIHWLIYKYFALTIRPIKITNDRVLRGILI